VRLADGAAQSARKLLTLAVAGQLRGAKSTLGRGARLGTLGQFTGESITACGNAHPQDERP